MTKITYILLLSATMLASCADNSFFTDPAKSSKSGAIEFAYSLPNNGTRTAISSAEDFPIGTAMAVEGFQTDSQGEVYHIFANDRVWLTEDGVNWTYEPIRYWDIASSYVFYAMYPYDVTHSFDNSSRYFTISNYVVANQKADQKDVMIAEEKSAMPENKVTFNFNHLLSQVNFFLKAGTGFNLDGVESIELTKFDLVGAKNTGSYVQTGFSEENLNVVGTWTVADEGVYDMPEITSADRVTTENPVSTIESGLLMLPQNLTGVRAYVSYKIHYVSGATASYSSTVSLPKALIVTKKVDDNDTSHNLKSWQPNYVYNYNLGVNPSQRGIDDYTIDTDGTEGGGDGVPDEGETIVVDDEGNWGVDTNGDGVIDVPIVWEDIDGDGKEEGGIDADGDGHIDNVDGENDNPDDNPLVTDGDDTNNPEGKDVILVDTDGDGICDTQLERDDDNYYPDPVRSMDIEFSAEVEDFQNAVDAEIK